MLRAWGICADPRFRRAVASPRGGLGDHWGRGLHLLFALEGGQIDDLSLFLEVSGVLVADPVLASPRTDTTNDQLLPHPGPHLA